MLGLVDNLIIVLFVLLVLGIGYYFSKNSKRYGEATIWQIEAFPGLSSWEHSAASWYGGIGGGRNRRLRRGIR